MAIISKPSFPKKKKPPDSPLKILLSNTKSESSRLELDPIKPYIFRLAETFAQRVLTENGTQRSTRDFIHNWPDSSPARLRNNSCDPTLRMHNGVSSPQGLSKPLVNHHSAVNHIPTTKNWKILHAFSNRLNSPNNSLNYSTSDNKSKLIA